MDKINFSQAWGYFANSENRNQNMLFWFLWFVAYIVISLPISLIFSFFTSPFGSYSTTTLIIANAIFILVSYAISLAFMTIPFGVLYTSFKDGIQSKTHTESIFDNFKTLFTYGYKHLAVFQIYYLPLTLITWGLTIYQNIKFVPLTSNPANLNNPAAVTQIYGEIFSSFSYIIAIWGFVLLYALLYKIFIKPAIMKVAYDKGFKAALNPYNFIEIWKNSILDLTLLSLLSIAANVAFYIVTFIAAITVIVCIGFILTPIVALIWTSFILQIEPYLFGQIFRKNKPTQTEQP